MKVVTRGKIITFSHYDMSELDNYVSTDFTFDTEKIM